MISIENGSYLIVGYVEVSKDKHPYYKIILEQKGLVKLYTHPKDMIVVPEGVYPNLLLVVTEKAGLRKAIILNNQIQVGSINFHK